MPETRGRIVRVPVCRQSWGLSADQAGAERGSLGLDCLHWELLGPLDVQNWMPIGCPLDALLGTRWMDWMLLEKTPNRGTRVPSFEAPPRGIALDQR